MTKKIIAFLIGISILFITSSVFATNEVKASMDKAGSSIQNAVNGAGNVVRNGASAIGNGIKDVGNSVQHGVSSMGQAATETTTTDGYTATRAATQTRSTTQGGTFLGMSANTWTWFVLAIAALAIIGLVWYYAMQNKADYNHHND